VDGYNKWASAYQTDIDGRSGNAESAEISGIPYIMDADRDAAE